MSTLDKDYENLKEVTKLMRSAKRACQDKKDRDEFAARAMQAIIQGQYSQCYLPIDMDNAPSAEWIAKLAMHYADAMMKAREDQS